MKLSENWSRSFILRRLLGIPCVLAAALAWYLPDASAQSYDLMMAPGIIQGRTVRCINENGQPVAACSLLVTPHVYNNTNGHFHNTNRPTSKLAATQNGIFSSAGATVITDSFGEAIVWVKPGQIGQAEYLKACAQYCGEGDHAVGYSDIYWVEEKPQWIHVGGNTRRRHETEFKAR